MNVLANRILSRPWVSITITFDNLNEVKATIPRRPGLYSISTNTPKEILGQFGQRNDTAHYNLMNKISASDNLPTNFIINQKDDELYCVYNGHHKSIKQRLSEHFFGSQGTGCLALFEIEELREYSWVFEYLVLTDISDYVDSKLYRTCLEQHLRVRTGWPILCSQ